MTLKSDAKFEQKLMSCFQTNKNFVNFDLKVKQICTLIGAFCAKYIKFDLKKYRGLVFHDTEE